MRGTLMRLGAVLVLPLAVAACSNAQGNERSLVEQAQAAANEAKAAAARAEAAAQRAQQAAETSSRTYRSTLRK